MPTSQSASERQRAASASGSICVSSRSFAKPSRIAPGVIDCSHRRRMGCLAFACWTISLKISSPSRPASQALTSASTSLRLISRVSSLSRSALFSIGLRSNSGGITGRWANDHLPRLTSYCSGAAISTRWPTADDSTYWSLSKKSPCLAKPPSARAMSAATEGFSAMIRAFPIGSWVTARPPAALVYKGSTGFGGRQS